MTAVELPLLALGLGTDRSSERGVECPGDLPAASDPDLVARARRAKELESLAEGQVANVIEVDPETEHWAKVALQRMLDLPGDSHRD